MSETSRTDALHEEQAHLGTSWPGRYVEALKLAASLEGELAECRKELHHMKALMDDIIGKMGRHSILLPPSDVRIIELREWADHFAIHMASTRGIMQARLILRVLDTTAYADQMTGMVHGYVTIGRTHVRYAVSMEALEDDVALEEVAKSAAKQLIHEIKNARSEKS